MLDLSIFGQKRVQLVKQTQITECGLAVLAMISNFYGTKTNLATLRQSLNPSLRGLSIKSLLQQGEKMGLQGRAVESTFDGLKQMILPAVLHWDLKHFVVLERIKKNNYLIHDPALGSRWLSEETIAKHFTGVAAEFQPIPRQSTLKPKLNFRPWSLIRSINGIWISAAQVILLSLVLQAYVLASPFYMQVAVDTVLPSLDFNLLSTLAIGFVIFTTIQSIALFLRSMIMLRIGAILGISISADTGFKLLRLPITWFEKRHTGDILSRFQSIGPINQTLTEGAVIIIIDGLLALTTVILMFYYSTILAMLSIAFMSLYFLIKYSFLYFERNATEDSIVDAAIEQTEMIENVEGIQTLRVFGSEAGQHASWLHKLTNSFNSNIILQRIKNIQEAIYSLLFGLENIVIIYLAIEIILDAGGFSLGMLFAYTAYKNSFINSSGRLVDQFVAYRMLTLHFDRVADIALTSEDECFSEDDYQSENLKESIVLKDLYFRYSDYDPFILAGINLRIRKGEHIAITGPSGGGKTTIAKLLLGLLEPTQGGILIDGIILKQFGIRNLQRQSGAVLQDGGFFHGSIAQSIALFDETLDMERVESAALKAGLQDEVMKMPMKYFTPIGKFGSALSGGQRQRLLIARAIYRSPNILIMDEATSHLDYETERKIIHAIKELKVTRITIAHRIDTIMAADRVFQTQAGRLVEVNKHEYMQNYLKNYTT
ncbi:peptidase domain-containing ABC transporter [Temperatibacter marinus]|uniref:Peptidase domain-containing ABC transporter n=1 Tax=Temperatibacter marinus TaxID=1456591 RepID=A0AA52EEL7_9PROT|nr:peptidase domain-containing ABC transporter [Temperatibacter marinus]WND01390.1 peptidase domain-containing ABC transporter [Temperatibacter marinus]